MARELAQRAIDLDAKFAGPWVLLARTYLAGARLKWDDSVSASLAKGVEAAERSLAIDENQADAYAMLGALRVIQRRYNEAVEAGSRSIEISPSAADNYVHYATTLNFVGRAEEAVTLIEKAMRLSPIYPAWYSGAHGFALRCAGRYTEATRALKVYGKRQQGAGHVDLAIIYVETDQIEAARHEVEEILQYQPEFTIGKWAATQMYRDSTHLEHDISALRKLDLPE